MLNDCLSSDIVDMLLYVAIFFYRMDCLWSA